MAFVSLTDYFPFMPKFACAQRETLTLAAFALDGNKWDGLYVGRRKGADMVYGGKVDLGFDRESAKALRARLTPFIRETQPYSKRIAHGGIWVEPKLLAEIEYRTKSAEGKVRHPVFFEVSGRTYDGGKDAFDRWWEWVERPPGSKLTVAAHFNDAVAKLSPAQRRDRTGVNEALRLADPDAQR
jgi:hypothetical protein